MDNIDDDEMVQIIKNLDTQLVMVNNGKYGGGRIMLNPLGFINDGYFELIFFDKLFSA